MPNPFELMHLIEIEGVLVGKIFSGYLREVIMYKKDYTLCKVFCTKKIRPLLFNSCIKNRIEEEPEGSVGLRSKLNWEAQKNYLALSVRNIQDGCFLANYSITIDPTAHQRIFFRVLGYTFRFLKC